MKNCTALAAVLGAAAFFASLGAASASLVINPVRTTTGSFAAETGQSIPTGTGGFVDGSLAVVDPGSYTFTFGPADLVAGATGHGDSTFINEFWVGATEAAAEAAGTVFCTQPGDASCGGVASVVGQSFTVNLPAGDISFGFTFGANNSNVILNDATNCVTAAAGFAPCDAIGAYLAQIGLGTTANAGPGPVAYLGLSDNTFPGDIDFQDLTVRVTEVPEPASLALLGIGLIGLAGIRRRRKAS